MNVLRELPKIDRLLLNERFTGLNHSFLTPIIKKKVEELRGLVLEKKIVKIDTNSLIEEIYKEYEELLSPSLIPLINATGVIIHTNLGRSAISQVLFENIKKLLSGYTNLEYDEKKGCRGERYIHIQKQLKTLLGVEDALVVNNNASAVFLILNTFAYAKESVVSRGELVEIGGSFRVTDVMARSGTKLVEVGTTNKTKLNDYINAINEESAILMIVHKSNFSIEGFNEEVEMSELSKLACEHGLIDYYDLGSGYYGNLPYNLSKNEPSLQEILKHNPSLVSFSGDKLLGGVQAGIIVGKTELIKKLKQNQLLRMLRVDKITLALLEETIRAYIKDELHLIPTHFLLNRSMVELTKVAKRLQKKIANSSIIESKTYVGGGTLPNRSIPTIALKIKGNAKILEENFRKNGVIGRIENDSFLLDLRALLPEFENDLIKYSKKVLGWNNS